MKDNLLTDPVVTVRHAGKVRRITLPGVFAALGRDEIESFPALRPHQRHAWHTFLCQVAVLALEQAGREDPASVGDESAWRELLRGLTPGFPEDEPWRLVVADLSKPAFLQPPVPEGNLKEFKIKKEVDYFSPLNLDVRVTAKEHGEKDGTPEDVSAEDWLLGLLNLQTFSGFLGQGNYGIARQNGGFAARHGVALEVSRRPGPNWLRDCRVILSSMDSLRHSVAGYPESGGMALLWLEPWAGTADESLPLRKLHPLFIEVCRRIRLVFSGNGGIEYRTAGTKGPRVAAKDYNGAIGDPWLPLRRDGDGVKAYNSRPGYDVAWKVLFDSAEYEPSLLQRFHPGDPEKGVSAIFRFFARTQGGSDGYYERLISIQRQHLGFFRQDRDRAAETAREMAGMATTARNRILKPALLQLMQAARNTPEYNQKETSGWAWRQSERLAGRVDAAFFTYLWTCLDARGEEALTREHISLWVEFLVSEIHAAFEASCDVLPTLSSLRFRGRARAENLLEAMIHKHLRTRSDNG